MVRSLFDQLAQQEQKGPDAVIQHAGEVARRLIKVDEGAPYWAEAARVLLRALILFVLAHEPPERRNLGRLRELLLTGGDDGRPAATRALDHLVETMKTAQGGPYADVIAKAVSAFERMGSSERGGVVTTAQEGTAFLDGPPDRIEADWRRIVGNL